MEIKEIKLKNRRVGVAILERDNEPRIYVEFKILEGRKIRKTELILTIEAATALTCLLIDKLNEFNNYGE